MILANLEQVYDGGIQAVRPGKTHLGAPMQTLNLGKTELPMDVVQDYLESLRPIYTLEARMLPKALKSSLPNAA